MAKLKFGDGITLEAQLPQKAAELPQNEVVAERVVDVPKVDLSSIQARLDDLESDANDNYRAWEISRRDIGELNNKINSDILIKSASILELHDKIEDIQLKIDEDKQELCPPTAAENTHIDETLASFSDRILRKNQQIKEVEAALNAKLDKQTKLTIALAAVTIISIITNLI